MLSLQQSAVCSNNSVLRCSNPLHQLIIHHHQFNSSVHGQENQMPRRTSPCPLLSTTKKRLWWTLTAFPVANQLINNQMIILRQTRVIKTVTERFPFTHAQARRTLTFSLWVFQIMTQWKMMKHQAGCSGRLDQVAHGDIELACAIEASVRESKVIHMEDNSTTSCCFQITKAVHLTLSQMNA